LCVQYLAALLKNCCITARPSPLDDRHSIITVRLVVRRCVNLFRGIARVKISYRRFAAINVVGLILAGLLFSWLSRDGRLDFWLTQQFFDPVTHSFPFKGEHYLNLFGHVLLKDVTALILIVGIALSLVSSWVKVLRPWRSTLITFCVMASCAALLIIKLKHDSVHACPWDLAMYGGKALWYPLFDWVSPAVELGRCWPGGHASGGFAIISGYFALRERQPKWANYFLLAGLVMGSIMGAVQIVRGAHFLSHNLWTLWFVWGTCFAIDGLLQIARFIMAKKTQAVDAADLRASEITI
jgi:membrane-associated PAP2 superfamily phosphatase